MFCVQTPCCNKVYTCRFCHDEQEAHTVNRKEVTELICVLCDTRQPVQATCQNCHCRFGKYTCLECNLFDDEDKNQYHCDGCGICRVGGRDRFFHCAKCNMCLPVQLRNGHTVRYNTNQAYIFVWQFTRDTQSSKSRWKQAVIAKFECLSWSCIFVSNVSIFHFTLSEREDIDQ